MRPKFIAVAALAAALVGRSDAIGCTCAVTHLLGRSGIAEIPSYDLIAAGTVVELALVEVPEVLGGEPFVRRYADVTIDVAKSWKGMHGATVVVRTDVSGAACGYSFELGESYLVYARGAREPYSAHFCDPTKPTNASAEEMKVLDKIFSP